MRRGGLTGGGGGGETFGGRGDPAGLEFGSFGVATARNRKRRAAVVVRLPEVGREIGMVNVGYRCWAHTARSSQKKKKAVREAIVAWAGLANGRTCHQCPGLGWAGG